MEDKNLNANQSIELIQQMIRGTRRRLSFGSSNLFLLWAAPGSGCGWQPQQPGAS